MKIESVSVDEILGTESKGIYGVHEEEKKVFSRSFSTDALPTISPMKVFSKGKPTKKDRSGNCSDLPFVSHKSGVYVTIS